MHTGLNIIQQLAVLPLHIKTFNSMLDSQGPANVSLDVRKSFLHKFTNLRQMQIMLL